ncbi:hypothetical protein CYOC110262_12195 [Cytobacillus oceanisediminis]|uniref:Uncharacterized protein n=1 Tax=Cytobacillus oceanisediminis TaxID=665099 RepID=A0A562JJ13_9BACI|nr:hypothetical protein IQ19_03886 [Cytobacillus oceanisediminis]
MGQLVYPFKTDAKVLYGISNIPQRYIEFVNDKDKTYRFLSN